MTVVEKVELALIPISGMVIWFLAPALPNALPVGRLLLLMAALVLLQSLIRDLWLLYSKRRDQQSLGKPAQCMCVESTVGVSGIVIGAILMGAGVNQSVSMSEWSWSALIVLVLSSGFLVKDYVVEWNPWRIRRDKDHMNIVFKWKK